MNRELINKLKEFIRENPPLNEYGEPKWWSENDWEKNLNKKIPNWRDILKKPDVWKEIRGVRPRRDYDDLLAVILQYAPPEILKEYLTSDDPEERKVAYKILTQDNGQRLTSRFWKLLNYDTRIWLISKIFEETIIKPYYHPFEVILHEYEELNIYHPLWIKLKAIIERSNDLTSMRKIEEIERKIERKVQLIDDKLKILFPTLQYICQHKYLSMSKNVLFDPSLLLDSEKARKVFDFMKKYYEDFNFFVPVSFYDILRENKDLDKIARFFEQERNISSRELFGMLKEHRRYYKIFEIPERFYYKKYGYFYENLRKEVEDEILAEILFEEWVFLQEFSWIVAKSKKTFEKFKEAGAVAIEFSEKAVDKIIRRTLKKKDDDFITIFDKLRALGKWIAVSLTAATPFLSPRFASLVIFGTEAFLILDPEDILAR